MKDYALLTASVVLLALDFAVAKFYQQKFGATPAQGLKFNALLGLFSAAVFFAFSGFKLEFSAFSALMAAGTAILAAAYTIIGFRIMSGEKMAMYTVFLMTGGMTVPYIWGLVFLGEPFSWLRTAGLVVIAAAVVIINADRSKADAKQIIMCVCVFFLNGFVSVLSKEHQISPQSVSSASFVVLTGLAKAIICAAVLPFFKDKSAPKEKCSRSYLAPVLILASAVISGSSFLLQLISAKNLPATVMYPIVTGGSIVFSAIAGRIFFKENASRRLVAGIIMCLAGTCLFL